MIIPKEQSHAFQRWEMASLDKKAAPHTAAAAPITPAEPEAPQAPLPSLPTQEEIERIYEEARQQGYSAGLSEGKAEFEASTLQAKEQEAQQLGLLIKNFEQALASLDQSVADQLLELGIEIASQVSRSSIAVKNDYLIPVIREAIATLPLHHAHLTLRLNPADAVHIRTHLGDQFAQNGTQIIEDGTITLGGCQLQAGASEVDASIETRWKRVLEAIGTEPTAWLNR